MSTGDPQAAELLERWQAQQDPEALDQLMRWEVERLKARLASGAALVRPSDQSRDDLAQDAVLKLLRADPPPRFASPAALRSYLWTAVRNLLIDRLRRGRREVLSVDRRSSDSLSGDPATRGDLSRVDREDLAVALEVVLNLLKQEDQVVLREVYLRGRSIEEAAVTLGVSRDAANMRLVRARVRLAEKLTAWRELVG